MKDRLIRRWPPFGLELSLQKCNVFSVQVVLRILIMLCALLAVPARTQAPDEIVVTADEPFGVWLNGHYVSLAISTATVDHIALNDPVVQRLGVLAAPRDNVGNLMIGGVVALVGRHGAGTVAIADRWVRQQLFWFPTLSPLPEEGTIGPFAIPYQTVAWGGGGGGGAGAALAYAWPLIGGINQAAYGWASVADRKFALGADVRMRRPLPLVTASTGADLADVLGGRLVGAPWQEEILLGVRRPVRRLQLDRPLEIGPLKFDAVAVRVGGAREGSMRLARGQQPLRAAEDDPAEMQVRGRTAVRRGVARVVVLSRNHLEAGGCISLTVAKRDRAFILNCGDAPAQANRADTGLVPLLPALPAPASPREPAVQIADGWAELPVDAPVLARIAGNRVSLGLSSGSLAAVLLNERVATRLAGNLAGVAGRFLYFGTDVAPFVGGITGVRVANRTGVVLVGWVPGEHVLEADGSIDLLALPFDRVRVHLQALPGTPLSLPLVRGDQWAAAAGRVNLPGVGRFELAAEVREHSELPLVTAPLAADLARQYGGQLQGEGWTERLDYGLTRRVRRLVLARPLVIGPLRFAALAVEVSPRRSRATRLERGQIALPDADADPAEIVVRGRTAGGGDTSRALYLSRTQLDAQRCATLAIDKPGKRWELTCAGPAPDELEPLVRPAGNASGG